MTSMELFGTAGIRGDVQHSVTPELALAVGKAIGNSGGGEVVIARDGRETGPGLAAAVEAGVLSTGGTVERAGTLPTPALAFASQGRHGVMVTASHNPPADNGLKLFRDGVEYATADERRIEALVEAGTSPVPWKDWGVAGPVDILDQYRKAVVAFANKAGAQPDGLRVALDCGNGTGGLITPHVLTDLGATVTALNANVDGRFPARPSEPSEASIADFCQYVDSSDVVLGFAQDGDADRLVVVDDTGKIVHAHTIVAILGGHAVKHCEAGDPVVVTTPNASTRIDEHVAAQGGRIVRVGLGRLHEGVAAARDNGGDVVFAAEPHKHLHPSFGGWIDGIASVAVLTRLVADGGSIENLVEKVAEYPTRSQNVACAADLKGEVMASIEEVLPNRFPTATVTTEYGVRLEFEDGTWMLIRPSGTEPFIRLYAEGSSLADRMATAASEVESAVEDVGK